MAACEERSERHFDNGTLDDMVDCSGSLQSPEITLCVKNLATKLGDKSLHAKENPTFHTADENTLHKQSALRRDRPFSASTTSRQSVSSRRSLSSTITTTDFASKCMFAYRSGAVERGVEDCFRFLVERDVDGESQESWLLTEIDHWDLETEKLIILTDFTLFVVKYDFIKQTIVDSKRIPLCDITNVQVGTLVYPSRSLMPSRNYGGVRVHFELNAGETSFRNFRFPWSRRLPYVTFTHHLLIYSRNEKETVTYSVDDFAESLIRAVKVERQRLGTTEKCRVSEANIVVESYGSLPSIIHNQSRLGFNLERGGISF